MNQSELSLDISSASSVKDLKELLISTYPTFAQLASFKLAINDEYVDDGHIIESGDEVVIIPPVSGG